MRNISRQTLFNRKRVSELLRTYFFGINLSRKTKYKHRMNKFLGCK